MTPMIVAYLALLLALMAVVSSTAAWRRSGRRTDAGSGTRHFARHADARTDAFGVAVAALLGPDDVLAVYNADNGALAEDVADAVEDAGGDVKYEHIPFANPGLWVSPTGPQGEALAKLLRELTGRPVTVDDMPGRELAVVVSRMPRLRES